MLFTPLKKPFLLLGISFLIIPSFSACSNRADQHINTVPSFRSQSDDILAAIEKRHQAVMRHVKRGELPEVSAIKADQLSIDLKKYIIDRQSKIAILKLDLRDGADDNNIATQNKIRSTYAEMENKKIEYLQRMQLLLAESEHVISDAREVGELHPGKANEMDTDAASEKTQWQVRDLDIEIEIAPEDISDGMRE